MYASCLHHSFIDKAMQVEKIIQTKSPSIIDVREKFEYWLGHAKGSTNMPLSSLQGRLDEIKALPKPLVLCCASGARSGQATKWLKGQGLKDVHNGGSWRQVREMMP